MNFRKVRAMLFKKWSIDLKILRNGTSRKGKKINLVKYIINIYIFTTDYPQLCAGASLAEPLHSSVTFFLFFLFLSYQLMQENYQKNDQNQGISKHNRQDVPGIT